VSTPQPTTHCSADGLRVSPYVLRPIRPNLRQWSAVQERLRWICRFDLLSARCGPQVEALQGDCTHLVPKEQQYELIWIDR
jgi:hypothetical protein